MSGIFPNSGVPAAQAVNTVTVTNQNCPEGALFHSTARCNPRFDPAAANAVMSEILNAVSAAGMTYDCSILNNLSKAIDAQRTCECPPGSGFGAPITAPLPRTSLFYVDISTSPDTLYWWNGSSWFQIGSGTSNPLSGPSIPAATPAANASTTYYDTTNPLRPIQYWWDGGLWRRISSNFTMTVKGAPIQFLSGGVYTPTGPDVIAIKVQVAGGGAGGASLTSPSGGSGAGSGGSAGGYAYKLIFAPIPAVLVVGAGGAADTDGGDSSFSMGTEILLARGGVKSSAMTGLPNASPAGFRARDSQNFGTSGRATGGDVNIQGQTGGSAVSTGGAQNGNYFVAMSGHGGDHPLGQGGNGETWSGTGTAGSNGVDGNGFGSGGGGGSQIGAGSKTGGRGAPGVVLVQEYT